jgi:hypothetical protein
MSVLLALQGGTAFTLNLSDTITLSDSPSKFVGKPQSDTITLSESSGKSSGKGQSDTVTLSESPVKATGKLQADTITLSDLFSESETNILSLSDTITLSDAQTKADGKVIDDTITLSDFITVTPGGGVNYTVNLADTITLSDSIDVLVPPQPPFPPVFLSGGGTEVGHPRMKALKPALKLKRKDDEIEELEIVAILTCWLGKN